MNLFLDSFWRAVAYCLRPRVIALSFLPLILMVALALGVGYFYWEPAIDWVRTEPGVGFWCVVCGRFCGSGAACDLDLHAGVCVFIAVVLALLPGGIASLAGGVG